MFNQLPSPLNVAQLEGARTPTINGYDAYPDCLYSTMVYPQAGQAVGTPLKFFQGGETAPSDISLTNVPVGTLPGGQMFHALKVFIVPLIETMVTGAAVVDASGLIRDLDRVFKTNRPQFTYTQTAINKTRGPFPLDALGEMGGVLPDFGGNNARPGRGQQRGVSARPPGRDRWLAGEPGDQGNGNVPVQPHLGRADRDQRGDDAAAAPLRLPLHQERVSAGFPVRRRRSWLPRHGRRRAPPLAISRVS
jgi:hypothetical protein